MAKKSETAGAAKPAAKAQQKPASNAAPAAATTAPVAEPNAAANPADSAAQSPTPVVAPTPATAAAAVPANEQPKDERKKDDLRDGVFVKSKPVSIRRCGFRFDRDGCGIALDLLTDEQVEQLENDPDLIVERCQFPMNEDA